MTKIFRTCGIGLVLLAVALGGASQDTTTPEVLRTLPASRLPSPTPASQDATAQVLGTAPEVLWTRTFGNPGTPQLAKKVRQTSDGGYVLVGGATLPGAGHYVYLVKTDSSGNLQWEKTLGDGKDDWGFDVQQTSDGGYIIAGADNGSGDDHDDRDFNRNTDVYLIKTDASGEVQWKKKFGGDKADKALRVQKTADGGYILIGVTASFGDGPWDVYLLKTDASGNLQWQKTFGTGGEDWGQAVLQTPDGGYILAGQIQVGEKKIMQKEEPTPIFNVYVVRTDSSGNLIWENSFGGEENNAKGRAIKITPDGNYIIAGTIDTGGKGDNDFYLLKVDIEGNMLWEERITRPVTRDNCWDMDVTADGGYILAGETITGTPGEDDLDVFVVRTDADGKVLWTKVIGETGALINDWARGVQQTSDGGYILAGIKTSLDGNKDAFLIKLAKDGQLPPAQFTEQLVSNPQAGIQINSTVAVNEAMGRVYVAYLDASLGGHLGLTYSDQSGPFVPRIEVAPTISGQQKLPDIAVDSQGNVHLAWQNYEGELRKVYFLITDPNGRPLGAPIAVAPNSGGKHQIAPSLAVSKSAGTFIAWLGCDEDSNAKAVNGHIYAAYRSPDGTIKGPFQVDDAASVLPVGIPVSGQAGVEWFFRFSEIAADPDSESVWLAYGMGELEKYYLARFDATMLSVGLRLEIPMPQNVRIPNVGHTSTAVGGDKVFVAFVGEQNRMVDVFFSTYVPSSGFEGQARQITSEAITANQTAPHIGADAAGNVYAVWEDNREGTVDIYFASSPNNFSDDRRVNTVATGEQAGPRIYVSSQGGVWVTWHDLRGADSDIYIAHKAGGTTGMSEHEELPKDFTLYQNYPNPFNSTTTIRFTILQRSHVTLKILDVLGREVATLVKGELNPGEHAVVFDARDLPSGVYFYRLTTLTFPKTKSMAVIK